MSLFCNRFLNLKKCESGYSIKIPQREKMSTRTRLPRTIQHDTRGREHRKKREHMMSWFLPRHEGDLFVRESWQKNIDRNHVYDILEGSSWTNTTRWSPHIKKECMEKIIHIVRTDEAPQDVTYWKTQSHTQRLATLESIRQEYIAWKYDHQPRFQRVYRIIKHP